MKGGNFFLILCSIFFCNSVYAYYHEYTGDCVSTRDLQLLEKCLNNEFFKYDKQLNKLYKEFNFKIRKSEILWVRFKIADCKYIATEVSNGLYYKVVYKACLINKTKERIADLNRSFFYYYWFKDGEEKSL